MLGRLIPEPGGEEMACFIIVRDKVERKGTVWLGSLAITTKKLTFGDPSPHAFTFLGQSLGGG